MADFRTNVMIDKPINEVFDYLTNLENVTEFMPHVTKIEKVTEGPVKEGTNYIETRLIRGREAASRIKVTGLEPNKSYTTKSELNGLTVVYHYEFDEIEEGTQIQFEANVHYKGLLKFITKPIMVKMLMREDGYHLQNLKEAIEKKDETHV